MTDPERFICGFCKTSSHEDRGKPLDEVTLQTKVAGEVVVIACGNCGAILGFVPKK
jgi:hypothetical protein